MAVHGQPCLTLGGRLQAAASTFHAGHRHNDPPPPAAPQALLARLLHRCIPLFYQEVDKRAGPLVGQLLGLGLTGTEAARCFERCVLWYAVLSCAELCSPLLCGAVKIITGAAPEQRMPA